MSINKKERKPGVFKEDIIHFRHGNSGENKFNDCCDECGLED